MRVLIPQKFLTKNHHLGYKKKIPNMPQNAVKGSKIHTMCIFHVKNTQKISL